MPENLECPKCGGLRNWRIRWMRERGRLGRPVHMAVAAGRPTRARRPEIRPPATGEDGVDLADLARWMGERRQQQKRAAFRLYGRYETIICAKCGFSRWYAHDLNPVADAGVAQASLSCRFCGSYDGWSVSHVPDRD